MHANLWADAKLKAPCPDYLLRVVGNVVLPIGWWKRLPNRSPPKIELKGVGVAANYLQEVFGQSCYRTYRTKKLTHKSTKFLEPMNNEAHDKCARHEHTCKARAFTLMAR